MVTVRDDTAHSDRTESTYARGVALGGRLANVVCLHIRATSAVSCGSGTGNRLHY